MQTSSRYVRYAPKTLHRFIRYWHARAARRSALPRERFSPLALGGTKTIRVFVKEFSNSMGKPVDEIADESMAALQEYHWPGNVRELRNVIERAMILGNSPRLSIKLGHTTLRPVALTAGLAR
jgi:hypothetical protein